MKKKGGEKKVKEVGEKSEREMTEHPAGETESSCERRTETISQSG